MNQSSKLITEGTIQLHGNEFEKVYIDLDGSNGMMG